MGDIPSDPSSLQNIERAIDALTRATAGLKGVGLFTTADINNRTTTSTSYTDAAGVVISLDVTVSALGLLLVGFNGSIFNNTAAAEGYVTVELSGANTVAAADDRAVTYKAYGANTFGQMGTVHAFTGLSPGATTIKLKYKVSAGSGIFGNRRLWALTI